MQTGSLSIGPMILKCNALQASQDNWSAAAELLLTSQELLKTEARSACKTAGELYQEEGGVSACSICKEALLCVLSLHAYTASMYWMCVDELLHLFDGAIRERPWLHFLCACLV